MHGYSEETVLWGVTDKFGGILVKCFELVGYHIPTWYHEALQYSSRGTHTQVMYEELLASTRWTRSSTPVRVWWYHYYSHLSLPLGWVIYIGGRWQPAVARNGCWLACSSWKFVLSDHDNCSQLLCLPKHSCKQMRCRSLSTTIRGSTCRQNKKWFVIVWAEKEVRLWNDNHKCAVLYSPSFLDLYVFQRWPRH